MEAKLDRSGEDIGNILKLEHVNITIPDQQLATIFYVAGLGLTRDPYIMVTTNNMWINVGRSQFHLPTGKPQNLRGCTAIVVPERAALMERLDRVKKQLDGTKFAFSEGNSCVETSSPWGDRVRCHFPDPARFGRIRLGMPYVEFDVPPGTADGIARFYREIMDAPAAVEDDGAGRFARVAAGAGQDMLFRETDRTIPPYDGHHLQIYINDFSGPYKKLGALDLISMENGAHEYRFIDIVDLDTRKVLFQVEHEVRSHRHPLYGRPLVNRNPAQTNMNYMPGHDGLEWFIA
jgi:catechol 2,3-dioxygenase-like lactoylglutathione lyase family enzyme